MQYLRTCLSAWKWSEGRERGDVAAGVGEGEVDRGHGRYACRARTPRTRKALYCRMETGWNRQCPGMPVQARLRQFPGVRCGVCVPSPQASLGQRDGRIASAWAWAVPWRGRGPNPFADIPRRGSTRPPARGRPAGTRPSPGGRSRLEGAPARAPPRSLPSLPSAVGLTRQIPNAELVSVPSASGEKWAPPRLASPPRPTPPRS